MAKILEVCCFNIESALLAQQAGADRIELCADPADGGTTPSGSMIGLARKKLDIALYPIIRSRGGDFLYSDEEFEIMLDDIKWAKEVGCDGVVFGILQADGSIDKGKCAKLISAAYPMGCTFHRAFDWSANPFEALEDIISLGFERILTSGQQSTAIQGMTLISDLIRQAEERIIIMPGSGVRSGNIRDLALQTGANEFHSSARSHGKSQMQFINIAMEDQQLVVLPDVHEIKAMKSQLALL